MPGFPQFNQEPEDQWSTTYLVQVLYNGKGFGLRSISSRAANRIAPCSDNIFKHPWGMKAEARIHLEWDGDKPSHLDWIPLRDLKRA